MSNSSNKSSDKNLGKKSGSVKSSADVPSFQELIINLQSYWAQQGCTILQPFDTEVGAGTLHPATVLRSLGPKPWNVAYVQPSRRPADGRYGDNPNRLQHYYQYQVLMKPTPPNYRELYLGSLDAIGIDQDLHDIRFVEDDWENPTVGAWGLGWEVWCDGMEVSQYTYFQQVGGLDLDIVSGELTYGLERLAMYVQGVDNVYDLVFTKANPDNGTPEVLYGDVFHQNEVQQSTYNFEHSDHEKILEKFKYAEAECQALLALDTPLPLPAYEHALKASHLFNLLDARGEGGSTPCVAIMAELLFEIFCEEIPARMQRRAGEDLSKALIAGFEKAGLEAKDTHCYTGPRRLVFTADIPLRSPDISEERKGPRVGAPEQALAGFMRGAGLDDISEAQTRSDKKGEYYVAVIEKSGADSAEIIAELIPAIMQNFPWPKSMKSGTSSFRWVRPLTSMICLLDGQIVEFEVGGVKTGNTTQGHRRHGKGPYTVKSFTDYRKTLEGKGHVMICACERADKILSDARAACTDKGLELVEDAGLLAEVAGLAEWPVVILGDMDPVFLELPDELIRLTLKTHQKTFTVRDPKTGALAGKAMVRLFPRGSLMRSSSRARMPRKNLLSIMISSARWSSTKSSALFATRPSVWRHWLKHSHPSSGRMLIRPNWPPSWRNVIS